LKMRMMHSGLEKQKRNLCYWSWHLSTSRRCLHGQSRQGPRKACSYRVEAGTADAPKLAFAA
jgi:hypothetical protein